MVLKQTLTHEFSIKSHHFLPKAHIPFPPQLIHSFTSVPVKDKACDILIKGEMEEESFQSSNEASNWWAVQSHFLNSLNPWLIPSTLQLASFPLTKLRAKEVSVTHSAHIAGTAQRLDKHLQNHTDNMKERLHGCDESSVALRMTVRFTFFPGSSFTTTVYEQKSKQFVQLAIC